MTASPRSLLKSVTSLSVAALLLGSFTASPAVAQPAGPSVDALPAEVVVPAPVLEDSIAEQPDRFIVKFKDKAQASSGSRTDTSDVTEGLGVMVEELRPTGDGGVILEAAEDLTDGQIEDVVVALEARADVEYAEIDQFVQPAAVAPNDALYELQWSLFEAQGGMRVQNAWDRSVGEGITVAVIDTGITAHSDLAANSIQGWDFISDPSVSGDGDGRDPNPSDVGDSCNNKTSSWHGTHVAGTIAAEANNGAGVAGVAHQATVEHIRALGICGGWTSDIAPAIVWAAGGMIDGMPANPNPAQVINLSLGGSSACGSTYQNAINFAVSQNVVVVVAAGNSAVPAANSTPASCGNVIAVGATGREGAQAPYSNYGAVVDVSAPGGDFNYGSEGGILSTYNQGSYAPGTETYGFSQGTSMAAPHVAGTAALMLAVNRDLTPAQVEQALKDTARPLPGYCFGGCGAGIVDAAAAVKAAMPDLPDVVGVVPTIAGSSLVGSTLTASAGAWSPGPVSLSYQWLRDGAVISGATATTYRATTADIGKKLSVKVIGTKTGFDSATRTSAQTAVITDPASAVVAPTPVISNSSTAKVGVALTTTIGTWKPDSTVLTYQWLREGAAITGAAGATYTPVAADLGKTLKIQVTGKSGSLASTVRTSAASPPIQAGTLTSSKPTIAGKVSVGSTLSSTVGTWTNGTAFTYQWLHNNAAISGATAGTHQIVAADAGKNLSVKVTGTKPGYTTIVQTSNQTAAVPLPAPVIVAPTPTLGATPTVGTPLTASIGQWAPGPVILVYQWLRSGTAISGATTATYTPVPSDLGKTLTIQVTGKSTAMPSTVRTSSPSKAVAPGILKAVKPTVSGFAAVGYTLTATSGTWASGTTVSYEWLRDGAAISGARSITYMPVAADATKRLSVKATGIKAGYTTSSSTSIETDAVPQPFKDVPVGTQFHREMSWLAAEGISTGWTEANGARTYRPLTSVNRDAMAAFMYRMAGSPAYTPPARSPFGDVSTSNQFYKEISWLASTGISTGYPDGTYRPLTSVNRDAMAAFMYRMANKPGFTAPTKSPFADVTTKQQFYKEMSWLASTGISTGYPDGTYRPLTLVKRDAMAAFMYRYSMMFQ